MTLTNFVKIWFSDWLAEAASIVLCVSKERSFPPFGNKFLAILFNFSKCFKRMLWQICVSVMKHQTCQRVLSFKITWPFHCTTE